MAKELMPQASTLCRTLDETGYVGNHETLALAQTHDTELRMQGCEWVVGNLGARVGHRCDKCALACIGHTKKAHIGQHLEFKMQPVLFSRLSRCTLARGAVGAGLEAQVAKAACSALCDYDALPRLREVGHHRVGLRIPNKGANRYAQQHVLASCPKLVSASTVLTIARPVESLVAEINQSVEVGVSLHVDMAATPTVTAVWPTERNEFFATKGHAAIAAIAGKDFDLCFVDEFHDFRARKHKPRFATLWTQCQ